MAREPILRRKEMQDVLYLGVFGQAVMLEAALISAPPPFFFPPFLSSPLLWLLLLVIVKMGPSCSVSQMLFL